MVTEGSAGVSAELILLTLFIIIDLAIATFHGDAFSRNASLIQGAAVLALLLSRPVI
jgi:hypothetical protein